MTLQPQELTASAPTEAHDKVRVEQADLHAWGMIVAHKVQALRDAGREIRVIVSIGRGGKYIGLILEHQLGFDAASSGILGMRTERREDDGTKFARVVHDLSPQIKRLMGPLGQYALIVDDVSDEGHATRMARTLYPRALIATACVKPDGMKYVDLYAARILDQDFWIVFDYEPGWDNLAQANVVFFELVS